MERPLIDTILVASIAAFFLFEALVLRREGILGWAMFWKCIALASLFGYGFIRPYYPEVDRVFLLGPLEWMIGTVLRLGVLFAMLVAVPALAYARWGRRRWARK